MPGYRGAARVCNECFEVEMGQTRAIPVNTSQQIPTRPTSQFVEQKSNLARNSAGSSNRSGANSQQISAGQKLSSSGRIGVDDFQLIKVLGRGSFGKVFLVRRKSDLQIFAMKVLKKKHLIAKRQIEHTQTERWVLATSNHPFVTTLVSHM